eukprot:m.234279 g.234279  ORF g.234279 m.234279 type:complete len:62 (+) comp19315_c0_seq3:892-1077(+)
MKNLTFLGGWKDPKIKYLLMGQSLTLMQYGKNACILSAKFPPCQHFSPVSAAPMSDGLPTH